MLQNSPPGGLFPPEKDGAKKTPVVNHGEFNYRSLNWWVDPGFRTNHQQYHRIYPTNATNGTGIFTYLYHKFMEKCRLNFYTKSIWVPLFSKGFFLLRSPLVSHPTWHQDAAPVVRSMGWGLCPCPSDLKAGSGPGSMGMKSMGWF